MEVITMGIQIQIYRNMCQSLNAFSLVHNVLAMSALPASMDTCLTILLLHVQQIVVVTQIAHTSPWAHTKTQMTTPSLYAHKTVHLAKTRSAPNANKDTILIIMLIQIHLLVYLAHLNVNHAIMLIRAQNVLQDI